MVLMLTGIRNTEKMGQQAPDQNTDLGADTTEKRDAVWSRRLGSRRGVDDAAARDGEAAPTVGATAALPGPYSLYEDGDAVAPVTGFASTEVVATTTATTTASTAEAATTITAYDRTTDVEGGTVLIERRKMKRLDPMPLMCVFGGKERSQSPLPEDGLCDLAYFDCFYRAGLLDTFAQRRHSVAFERFVAAAAKYRLTEVGVAVASEGNSKAQEELSSPNTWASLRQLWNKGVVHFGVLDFEVTEGTTPVHVDHIFDLLFLLREAQLRLTTRKFDQWPYLALGIMFLERSDNELFRTFIHHVGQTRVQLLVLRTHLSGRDDTNPECTITGSSTWGEPLARYHPNIMETLEFLRIQNFSLEASVIMVSMSLAARFYAPLDSFDPGSKCIALDDGERRLGSFAENCKDGAYAGTAERLVKYEVIRSTRTQPRRRVIIFDSEDTIFAKYSSKEPAMSDSREQVADKAATSDALSSAPAALRAPAAAELRTAATEAPAAPKAAAAVVSGTPQRADDRPSPRKRRRSTASQLSQTSRSSRSRRKKLKQKPDDDLAQRLPEATPVDGNQTIAGSSGGVASALPAGLPPVDSVIPVGDTVAPAVPPAGPSALASDAVPPAGTVSSADALPPASSGSAATTTGPPAGAVPYGGGSAVVPAAVQPSAKASGLVRNAWSLLSPPTTRPLEYDSRRTSVASVAAALVFKPRIPRRWRMNESSRGDDVSALDPSTRSLNTQAILIVFCSAVILLVVFVFAGTRKTADREPVCDTSDCRLHRYTLESGMDPSVDPCDNFSAYVCAKWQPRHRSARSALSDMVLEWLIDLPKWLRRSAPLLPTATKATTMFDVCMNQAESTADVALRFLRDRGLQWPDDGPDGTSSPAEVLFDLAFNWKAPLWFSIQMLPNSQDYPHQRRLLLAPNDLISQWAPFFNDINERLYVRYWNLFYREMASGNAARPTKAAINESFHVQRFVFDVLLRAATNRNKRPAVLPLKALADYPELSSAGFVADVISRKLGLGQESSDDVLLLVSDQVFLDAMREIFRRLSASQLKRHLAWLFVQTHGLVADPGRLLFALFGEMSRARQERPRFCAAQVEASYELLVAAADSVARFTAKERDAISDRLADVVKAAIKKTQGSLWLDDRTKAIAIEKFSKARITLWPRGEYLTADALERAFKSFPRNGTTSLTQLWEETRLVWHALRDTPEADEDYRLPGSYTQPYARYWYLLNTVRLSLGLLAHPAYHREGTRAMLFGGLGFLFARQLVGAVDGSGVGVDATGKPVAGSWIGDSTARVNFERRLRCEGDLFPDVPAVEVAFTAFLDGASNGLRLSHRFSEPQVFFLTLCHLTCACGHPDNLYGADCNRVVRNFQPFADAFRCAPGSKMNPTNKCRFFG
ncbi:uncharacterized protein [Dermacentor albipictus]|uniref:uncharacterized protein isoform X2 n=1 Tax=Dermacentor albipictus TaxID=60249 RepID=UPI0038FCBD0A